MENNTATFSGLKRRVHKNEEKAVEWIDRNANSEVSVMHECQGDRWRCGLVTTMQFDTTMSFDTATGRHYTIACHLL